MDRTNGRPARISSGTATVKVNKSKNWHGKKGMKWGYSHGVPNGNRTAKFPIVVPNLSNLDLETYVNQWITTSSKINPDGSISIGGIKNPVYEGRYWLYSKNPKLLDQHLK